METNIQYTSFYRRLLAHYADTLLLFLPNLVALFFVASTSQSINQLVINVLLMVAIVTLPLMILSTFYSVLMIHFFAATIGQAVSGYAILNSDGTKLNLKRTFFRQTVGKMASSTMFFLGYLSIIKHPQKQAWHDEMVASYAVSRKNTWPLAILLIFITLGLVLYLLFNTVMAFAKNEPLKKEFVSLTKTISKDFTRNTKNNQSNGNFNILLDDARQNYYKGEFQKQLENSELALKSASTNKEKGIALYWRGLAKYKLSVGKDKSDAKIDMEESSRLYPENAGPYVTLSAIESEKGNYQDALTLARKCAQLDPKYGWCHNNIGLNLLFLGQKEEAIIELEKAVSLDSESLVFQDNLRRARLGR